MGLTERRIRDAKPEGRTRILWDEQVKGLGLRVTKAGVKAFILNYRVDGRERRATLARANDVSLTGAREMAREHLAKIRMTGEGPLERREAVQAEPTVADGLDRFFDEWAVDRVKLGRMAESTVKGYRLQARVFVEPAIGHMRISAVTRRHIEAMVRPIAPVQRNRTLAFASRLFRLFEDWDWRPQHSNPVRGVDRTKEEPRDRTLTGEELAALFAALANIESRSPAPVAAIRFAAVTGLRIGEVLAIKWEHVDFETARLTLPETKTGRRTHDLPQAALLILEGRPRINGNPWAFTSGKAATTYHHCRNVMRAAARDAGLENVRPHDLRRTVMTRAAANGASAYVLRDLLGHKTTAMADRYIRALGNPVREAREAVGAEMAALIEGRGGDVVDLRGRHA